MLNEDQIDAVIEHIRRRPASEALTGPRQATDPVADLSRSWAQTLAEQIPAGGAVTVTPWSPYTGRALPRDDRLGAMIESAESADGAKGGRAVQVWTYVAVCVRHDGARELRVQVYGMNTAGVSERFRAPVEDGPALAAFLKQVGLWAAAARREVAALIAR